MVRGMLPATIWSGRQAGSDFNLSSRELKTQSKDRPNMLESNTTQPWQMSRHIGLFASPIPLSQPITTSPLSDLSLKTRLKRFDAGFAKERIKNRADMGVLTLRSALFVSGNTSQSRI